MFGNSEGRKWYIAGIKAIVKGFIFVLKFLFRKGGN